ncbi:hypothetical protein BLOT_014812 [Blomia tropicalis]|nr:hypothetical protein BLOT_014812 [Blomia tropicalis]
MSGTKCRTIPLTMSIQVFHSFIELSVVVVDNNSMLVPVQCNSIRHAIVSFLQWLPPIWTRVLTVI